MSRPLKILQLGCGSMGTRRLRDLSARTDVTLRLYDARADRRAAAQSRFQVAGFPSLETALDWQPDAVVISTPPGTKGPMAQWAVAHGVHHFVEADIWSYGVALEAARHPKVVSAPSLSFAFLPVVRALVERVPETIGRLLGYQFGLAGEMADWHPAEGREYYGRHRDTAPAREMVPFELAWLAEVFGRPSAVSGTYGRFSGRPESIEETWSLLLRLENGGTGQLTVTMATPENFRRGSAFGTTGSVHWDINRGEIVLQRKTSAAPEVLQCGEIGQMMEPAYAAEINRYVEAVLGRAQWPHDYGDYQHAIATLAAAEASPLLLSIDPSLEPARILQYPAE